MRFCGDVKVRVGFSRSRSSCMVVGAVVVTVSALCCALFQWYCRLTYRALCLWCLGIFYFSLGKLQLPSKRIPFLFGSF